MIGFIDQKFIFEFENFEQLKRSLIMFAMDAKADSIFIMNKSNRLKACIINDDWQVTPSLADYVEYNLMVCNTPSGSYFTQNELIEKNIPKDAMYFNFIYKDMKGKPKPIEQ